MTIFGSCFIVIAKYRVESLCNDFMQRLPKYCYFLAIQKFCSQYEGLYLFQSLCPLPFICIELAISLTPITDTIVSDTVHGKANTFKVAHVSHIILEAGIRSVFEKHTCHLVHRLFTHRGYVSCQT